MEVDVVTEVVVVEVVVVEASDDVDDALVQGQLLSMACTLAIC